MTRLRFAAFLILLLSQNYTISAWADESCYSSSKTYRIHPVRGGVDLTKGWTVEGKGYPQCVRRSELANRQLKARYPDSAYRLSLTATIGCHAVPCNN